MIKVNKFFFSSQNFLKEIENMFSVFPLSYRKTRESLGELEKAAFLFSQTSTSEKRSQSENGIRERTLVDLN